MKIMGCNNSISNIKEKYSKKRLSNISNRIRSLEKDINILKNKETLYDKKSFDINTSLILDKNNNTMITNETKLKPNNKYNISHKNFFKNYMLYNDNKSNIKYNTNNNSFSNKKHKNNSLKESSKSQIYKKINNYNSLIHEKKNSLLNLKSYFHKRANTKESYKELSKISSTKNIAPKKKKYKIDYIKEQNLYERTIHPKLSEKKKSHLLSVDKINSNFTNKDNTSIINDIKNEININKEIKDMGKLEYEFEIRHLKKKRNALKQKNKEIIEKLKEIKNKNNYIEDNIVEEEKKNQHLINNLIMINKNYILHNIPNGLESIESSRNGSVTDEYSLKNIILNIMDIKFDYENNILTNNFIKGIKELLKIPMINKNFDDDILDKLKELIKCNNDLEISNNKYEKLFKENNKYLIYFKNLIRDLNLFSYEELYKYIQDTFVKNIKENERMKLIKKALINDSKPDRQILLKEKENIKRIINNKYSNSVNQTLFDNNDNNYYKIKNSYIDKVNNPRLEHPKKYNYLYSKKKDTFYNFYPPQNLLNRTEKSNNNNNNCNSITNKGSYSNLLNINNHSIDDNNLQNKLFFYQNDKNYISGKNSQNKIYNFNLENTKNDGNINTLMRHKVNNGKTNYYNRYISQNNFFKNEDDINFEEEEKIGNNNYTFNKRPLGQTKNHSAINIIYNK